MCYIIKEKSIIEITYKILLEEINLHKRYSKRLILYLCPLHCGGLFPLIVRPLFTFGGSYGYEAQFG